MQTSLVLEASTGAVRLAPGGASLRAGCDESQASAALGPLVVATIDHGNGYRWLQCKGLTLFSMPCGIGFCFDHGALRELHFGVALPGAVLEDGWPTRAAIDQEIGFMREHLGRVFARSFRTGREEFSWGVVWSAFDQKGYQASSGLRYRA